MNTGFRSLGAKYIVFMLIKILYKASAPIIILINNDNDHNNNTDDDNFNYNNDDDDNNNINSLPELSSVSNV